MRPYVIINVAGSIDGKISTVERKQVKISNEEDLRRVDRLRAFSDGIMVGIGTVLSDNPSLTVKNESLRYLRRMMGLEENPVRIVVDSKCRIPDNSELLVRGRGKRILAVSEQADDKKIELLKEKFPSLEVITVGEKEVNLSHLMEKLWKEGIKNLLVEGGGNLNFSLINLGLVDEIQCYVGNMVIGGSDSPTIADGEGFKNNFPEFILADIQKMGEGVLLIWKRK